MNIVIIDDEPDIREILRESLEIEGHTVVEAENGASGLEVIRNTVPDLIVCDIRMPEMTGDELFDALRGSDPDLGVIPFIFLSGDADTSEQIIRLNKGADNCFQKPVNLKLLAAHINSHLSRITRVSDFVKRKLDSIAESLPKKIEHDFLIYTSITANTNGYVDAIIAVINDYHESVSNQQFEINQSDVTGNNDVSDTCGVLPASHIVKDELCYIRYCLNIFNKRREIVRSANGEDISWTLIFLVALAQLQDKKIFVSELHVCVPSAKTTVNARLNHLIDDGVFTKNSDSKDGRRQQISLTDHFMIELMNHINTSIHLIKQVHTA